MTGSNPSDAEDPSPMGTVAAEITLLICSSCRRPGDGPEVPRPGSRLADTLATDALATDAGAADSGATDEGATDAGVRVAVRRVACLGNCSRGLSAAMYRPGSWTYVFGGLDEAAGPDLLAAARLFAGSTDGFLPFRGRPETLKRGLIARIPPIEMLEDLP
ncbi:MAG: DUF1636 family protein [Amaricoccus sp.]|uniref:DUF1636 family protein n=1 Tax=Amaricoccus sp. TaxID=1872485 RepID=UPI0039E2208F